MSDLRRSSFSAVPFVVALVALATASSALAQVATPTRAVMTNFNGEDLSPQQRELMYASLAKEVEQLERQSNIIKVAAKLVSPTVVHIESETHDSGGRPYGRRTVEETGSGVIIQLGDAFYVLTNRHVVKDAQLGDIDIRFADGRMLSPTKVAGDPDTDIAIMTLPGKNYIPCRLGNSDLVDIGDMVLAVGSPFRLSHSITYGIVSAKGRRNLELGDGGVKFQDFIQTDAAINPGNSGGPLINLKGEIIGINTAIASNSGGNEGIGFSIPVNMVMAVAKQLAEHGTVHRAFLGVHIDTNFTAAKAAEAGLPRKTGARLSHIEPGSPAAVAGMQADDVIVTFNGARIESDNDLITMVGLTPLNSVVPVVIYRKGQVLTLQVKVTPRSAEAK
jgi:serine protease Do